MVERNLAKVEVAGSSLVFRSDENSICESNDFSRWNFYFRSTLFALMAELVDARDLKSLPAKAGCRFDSCLGHNGPRFHRGFFVFGSFLFTTIQSSGSINLVGYDGYRAMSCKTFFKILSREFLAVIAHQKMTVR